jgi:hypothetical protein
VNRSQSIALPPIPSIALRSLEKFSSGFHKCTSRSNSTRLQTSQLQPRLPQTIMTHTSDNTGQYATITNITEEQKQLKDAAEKAEQERQVKWANRADVVYHFFAYRYFDRSSTCLDLLNFSDADVDSFNLTANKTRGLNNWHVCAEYLKKLDTPTLETTTHRRKFIYHVRAFNRTQKPHFRFYIRNLTADDVEYVEGLCKQENNSDVSEVKQPSMLIWASSCVEDEVREEAHEEDIEGTGAVDHMEVSYS